MPGAWAGTDTTHTLQSDTSCSIVPCVRERLLISQIGNRRFLWSWWGGASQPTSVYLMPTLGWALQKEAGKGIILGPPAASLLWGAFTFPKAVFPFRGGRCSHLVNLLLAMRGWYYVCLRGHFSNEHNSIRFGEGRSFRSQSFLFTNGETKSGRAGRSHRELVTKTGFKVSQRFIHWPSGSISSFYRWRSCPALPIILERSKPRPKDGK